MLNVTATAIDLVNLGPVDIQADYFCA